MIILLLGALGLSLLVSLLSAWPAMLMIGVLHHEVFPQVPALGFWHTLILMVTLAFVLPKATVTKSN